MQEESKNAYILRIAPGRIDRLPDALESNELSIGWSEARGLLDETLGWEDFRQIVHDVYTRDESDYRKSGGAAGHLWRFIREMNIDDLVVIPYGSEFFVAEVTSAPYFVEDKIAEGTAYRRGANWLNNKQPIPRRLAKAALQSRMKAQGTTANAGDLVNEIIDAVSLTAGPVSFEDDLRERLIQQTVAEIRAGRIDSFGFENLIRSMLQALGSKEARVIPRKLDKGADIIAMFRIAGAFQFKVAVQAKHYQPTPPVGVEPIDQLVHGMQAENADLGMVITSGTFSQEAEEYVVQLLEQGTRIVLIDGEQLASLVIDYGLTGQVSIS